MQIKGGKGCLFIRLYNKETKELLQCIVGIEK